MGLEPNFSVTENPSADKIYIEELTGLYHSVNNPTGYYGVNPTIAQVESAIIRIRRPDPDTLRVSDDENLEFEINIFPTIPNLYGTRFEISPEDIGLDASDKFPDGAYDFQVRIIRTTATAFDYAWRKEIVLYKNLECCSKNMDATLRLDAGCSDCKEKLLKAAKLSMAVDAVIASNNCGKPNQALDSLKVGQSLCDNEGCSGCN